MDRDTSMQRAAIAEDVMVPTSKPREPLDAIARRMKKALAQGAAYEGAVAIEVMRMADEWDRYKAEADGLELGPWLRKFVDPRRGLSWYERKAKGANTARDLGVAECMDSVGACWWTDHVPEKSRKETAKKIRDAYVTGGRVPLNRDQVSRICASFVTRRKSRMWASDELKALRARVARLEAQIRDLGAAPVE